MSGPEPITKTFSRFRYIVEVEADSADIADQIGIPDPRDALQSEIKSNLESLGGVRSVTVEPTA
jgi:hypothetical protein